MQASTSFTPGQVKDCNRYDRGRSPTCKPAQTFFKAKAAKGLQQICQASLEVNRNVSRQHINDLELLLPPIQQQTSKAPTMHSWVHSGPTCRWAGTTAKLSLNTEGLPSYRICWMCCVTPAKAVKGGLIDWLLMFNSLSALMVAWGWWSEGLIDLMDSWYSILCQSWRFYKGETHHQITSKRLESQFIYTSLKKLNILRR